MVLWKGQTDAGAESSGPNPLQSVCLRVATSREILPDASAFSHGIDFHLLGGSFQRSMRRAEIDRRRLLPE